MVYSIGIVSNVAEIGKVIIKEKEQNDNHRTNNRERERL